MPANDDFENDQKHPFSSSNQVERVCTAEEAAVLAAQLTAERVTEALKAQLAAVHQSNDKRLKQLESMVQGLQKENDIKNMNAKVKPAQNAVLHSILRSPHQIRRNSVDESSKASTDSSTTSNKSQTVKPRKPLPFINDGTQIASVWLRQLQTYFKLAGIEPKYWVSYAESYLEQEATQWWSSYLDSVNSTSEDIEWSTFCHLFLQRFATIASEPTALTQLQSLRQTGSVEDYI